jgi:hypothetical protein
VSAPEPKDLLAAYRAERGPTRAQADALWSRLRSDVARPSEVPRRVVPIAGRSRGRAVAIAAVVLAAAAVAVLALRPSGRRAESTAPEDRSLSSHEASPDREGVASEAPSKTTRVDPPPEREAIAVDDVAPAPAPEPEPDAPPDTRAPVRRPGARKPAVEAPAPVTDSLAEETSLIRRARAALSAGRAAAAIDLLRDYEDRFASGRLAEEADAVRTMARCRQAPSDPGALAEGFVARHGGSLFRKQVEAACAAADEPDAG